MIKNPTYKFYEFNHLRADGTTSLRIAAVSSFAGKPVKGYADCHPNDEFDREYGYALAAARCAEKIAAKRNARATRKVAEAQDILAEAIAYLNDMLDYQINSADELAIANAEVNKLISKM